MDFFKSVFSDEQASPKSRSESQHSNGKDDTSSSHSDPASSEEEENLNFNQKPNDGNTGGKWSFGGLMQTLATKSESVFETYCRDLKEFSSGLKKEIEVAQESFETVGHAIDEFGSSVLKNTAHIISQGKEALLSTDIESYLPDNNRDTIGSVQHQSSNPRRYSRFDGQVRVIQANPNTFCEEPEDVDDFTKWKKGFLLEEKIDDVKWLLKDNDAVESIHKKVVPKFVSEETFWGRYFYRLHKLKQAEDLRVNLVKRVITREEEELSWDVDDDDDDDDDDHASDENLGFSAIIKETEAVGSKGFNETLKDEETSGNIHASMNLDVVETVYRQNMVNVDENVSNVEIGLNAADNGETDASESDVKVASEAKICNVEACHDAECSSILSHASIQEEEDLGWDEIVDVASIDEKKVSGEGCGDKVELQKLQISPEDEDLRWDMEEEDDDDDKPVQT